MKIFTWDVQYFCPLKCVYCYSSSGPLREQATLDDLHRVARAIAREKPDAVMISGGEPVLAKGLGDVVTFLRKNGISLSVFTSGWGLNDLSLGKLARSLDRIHVSLDSKDPAINDSIRGRVGAHKHASNALQLLANHRHVYPLLRFGVDCTVVKSNVADIHGFCESVAAFEGLNFINISPAVPTGRASKQGFQALLGESEVAWLMSQATSIRKGLPESIALSVHGNEFLKTENDRHIHLNANGDVRAIKICEQTIGNLVDEPLDSILKRAARWRAASPLARSLPAVTSFSGWRDLVAELDRESNQRSRFGATGVSDDSTEE